MKKLISSILILLLIPTSVWAIPPDFSGGVNNEYTYEEVIFLSGEPIKFIGSFTTTEREKDNEKTITYRFNKLTPEDKSIDATLTRSITYVTQYDQRNDKGQTLGQTEVTKYSEKIKIGNDNYELKDYQFSKSDIIDNRPASDYYSGNMTARKTYDINRGQGEVVMYISGGNVGYENFWGSTETQLLDYTISSKRTQVVDGEAETETWEGTVNIQVSDSQTKTLKYSENDANFSSINGGHIRTTNSEMVSRYEYNLPRITEGTIDGNRRARGTIQLSQKKLPKLERLIVPKFRDVNGHWAQDAIEKLYSLDVFDEQSSFFSPNIAFTRLEFTKGVIKASNMRTSLAGETKRTTRRNQPVEESKFKDIQVTDKDYEYIKEALNKKIISGVSADLFQPHAPLTKAQAITILIQALGFENKVPNPGYYTMFSDDNKIPNWARDSIYVAREINLVSGDDYNRIDANKVLTRAEASVLLVKFLEFLEKDLQRDYRENIINFR